jgi:hypothetical protein
MLADGETKGRGSSFPISCVAALGDLYSSSEAAYQGLAFDTACAAKLRFTNNGAKTKNPCCKVVFHSSHNVQFHGKPIPALFTPRWPAWTSSHALPILLAESPFYVELVVVGPVQRKWTGLSRVIKRVSGKKENKGKRVKGRISILIVDRPLGKTPSSDENPLKLTLCLCPTFFPVSSFLLPVPTS